MCVGQTHTMPYNNGSQSHAGCLFVPPEDGGLVIETFYGGTPCPTYLAAFPAPESEERIDWRAVSEAKAKALQVQPTNRAERRAAKRNAPVSEAPTAHEGHTP